MGWEVKSRATPGKLLAIVNRRWDMERCPGRVNLTDHAAALQAATINECAGRSYGAHKHLPHNRGVQKAAEVWVVIKGRVGVTFYDTNSKRIASCELGAGDMVLMLDGGHAYKLNEDSCVYEFKVGPYPGRERDKEMIDDARTDPTVDA